MKLIFAFLKLVRWPNLLFIAVTQWLFYFMVVDALRNESNPSLNPFTSDHPLFYLLIAASILIAGAGYIINDYFDMQIDAVNKPEKVVVNRVLKRRWAIVWHIVFSLSGILLSMYIGYKTGSWVIIIVNTCCVILLWFYSTHFKKKLLIGNILIAALTAWVIIVVYFFAGARLLNFNVWNEMSFSFDIRKLFKLTMLYAGFAFIVSLIREVVKDLEDMQGDAMYNCRTMPIVWGVPASKVFNAVWIIICIALLSVVQLYAWQSGWKISVLYIFLLLIIPLFMILNKLYKAQLPLHYHKLSSLLKLVMLAGILSMLFFKFS